MENANTCTPARTPHSRTRSVWGGISRSGSQLNVPSSVPSEKHEAAAIAANQLINFNGGSLPRSTHRRSLSTASGPRHRRQLSKAARSGLLRSITSSSGETSSNDDSVLAAACQLDLGNSEHPIIHFRPQLWRHLETTRDALNLDLFWPQKLHELAEREEEDRENIQCERHVFSLEGLVPLCEFRRLRSLRLGEMLQSYQTCIWRTCWLNPGLEELVLEMALEPTMNESDRFWTLINGMWRRKAISEACTDYLLVTRPLCKGAGC
jgi:hypothetical protein